MQIMEEKASNRVRPVPDQIAVFSRSQLYRHLSSSRCMMWCDLIRCANGTYPDLVQLLLLFSLEYWLLLNVVQWKVAFVAVVCVGQFSDVDSVWWGGVVNGIHSRNGVACCIECLTDGHLLSHVCIWEHIFGRSYVIVIQFNLFQLYPI